MRDRVPSSSLNMTRSTSDRGADTIVLGAGPAGIGAALSLDRRAIVLERSPEVAGLCRTINLDGAIFDLGGHSFHTPHLDVRRLVFDALPMEQQQRQAWCLAGGAWIAYPFQRHFHALSDAKLRDACAAGLAAAGDGRDAANFDVYLDQRFGRDIAETFLRPYNAKLWGPDLARMSADWTAERVAAPAGTPQQFAESGGRRLPLQHDTLVAYPARGGYGEIFRTLARRLPDLRLGEAAERIDPARRLLWTDSGRTLAWRRIVSTLPLPDLLMRLVDVPAEIVQAARTLEALPVDLVMVVLEGQGRLDRQRVYSAGVELPGHKLVFNHTSSNWLRDRPRHGLLLEVAGGRQPPADILARDTVDGLVAMGLIEAASDVRRVDIVRLPLGYPVPTHARTAIMDVARAWLAEHDIVIAGRFAEWAYINADEALARGLKTGAELARAP